MKGKRFLNPHMAALLVAAITSEVIELNDGNI